MDLPVPTHLQQYLIPIGDENNEYQVTGNIRCLCGNEKFEIFESNKRHIIKLICSQCREALLLFDAGKHGWNGFVCGEEEFVAFDDSFAADDWINAFECIAISLSCGKCKFSEEDYVVLETM